LVNAPAQIPVRIGSEKIEQPLREIARNHQNIVEPELFLKTYRGQLTTNIGRATKAAMKAHHTNQSSLSHP
jgi:hypothetical protein